MSGKAAGAYLTISEVSEKLDVPSHVLRFWETKFTQLKPLKRGGGRRYYREADIELLSRIRHLLYNDGFTIKGAQKALKSPDTQSMPEAGDSAGRPADSADSSDVGVSHANMHSDVDTGAGADIERNSASGGDIAGQPASNDAFNELRTALLRADAKLDALLSTQK